MAIAFRVTSAASTPPIRKSQLKIVSPWRQMTARMAIADTQGAIG